MRYAQEFNLLFLHVPKSAGLSVKRAMDGWSAALVEQLVCDVPAHIQQDRESASRGYLDHPELGSIHMGHIPLPLIRTHFPTVYETIRNAERFAVLRNPEERFLSAISQYLREFRQVGASHITDAMVHETAREMIAKVSGRGMFADRHAIHFAPQSWFVEDPEAPLLVNLFAMDRMDVVARWMTAQTGKPAQLTELNTTVRPKSRYAGIHAALARLGRIAPAGLAARLRPLVLRLPMYKKSWSGTDFRFDAATRAFIEDFYQRDFELYAEALKRD